MDQQSHSPARRNIVVTGFPYAFPYYFKVFESFQEKDDLVFILPEYWEAKQGAIRLPLPDRPEFVQYGLKAWSYGGKSFLRGIFKGWMPALFFTLLRIRVRYGARVLYSCSEPHLLTTLCNGIAASILGMKHVIFTWQNISPERRMHGLKLRLSNALVRLNLFLSAGIICGNKKAELIIQSFDAKIKTLVCPLSGVDTERFSPGMSSWRAEHQLEGVPVLLFTGALDDRKGIDTLLKAHAQISSLSHVVIVGTGPACQDIENLVKQLGTADRVHFIDWMPNEELPKLMRSADIFVYPSRTRNGWEEQFGYAMAEASASGLPVISTHSGSIEEVVQDGITGLLIPPDDFTALTEALEKLTTDPERRRIMGLHGREYVVDRFSNASVADKLESFLHSLI